jgi:hypothetical protein
MARFRASLLVVAVALSVGTPTQARAQETPRAAFPETALRMEGRVLLRGTRGDTLARPGWWFDASLPLDALLSDSAKTLGAHFNREGRRAQAIAAVGGVLLLGGLGVALGHDNDVGDLTLVNRGDAAGLWGTRIAVGGAAIALIGSDLWSRAVPSRDRALWAHNTAAAVQP